MRERNRWMRVRPRPSGTMRLSENWRARSGDSRLTDHFYAFTGTPGDLVIAIETQNLNGDMDVFTAGGLRPVLKVALYAEIGSPVSKECLSQTT